jgi:Tfp pilus assembly protein PilX
LHHRNSNGYVLIIVLIFLQVLSLLSWYSLSANKLMMTVNRDKEIYDHQTESARAALFQIENDIQGNEPCLISPISVFQLSKRKNNWWHIHACEIKEGHHQYVIEWLGLNPCAKIKWNNHLAWHAQFYRITLRSKSDTIHTDLHLLQSVVAIKTNDTMNCPLSTYWIKEGVQMRREI